MNLWDDDQAWRTEWLAGLLRPRRVGGGRGARCSVEPRAGHILSQEVLLGASEVKQIGDIEGAIDNVEPHVNEGVLADVDGETKGVGCEAGHDGEYVLSFSMAGLSPNHLTFVLEGKRKTTRE